MEHPEGPRARYVFVNAGRITIGLANDVTVVLPLKLLGEPWTSANAKQLDRVSLRMDGTMLWWYELGEGLRVDQLLSTVLNFNPAAMLARKTSGQKASPAKAAAARANGKKGGRPNANARLAKAAMDALYQDWAVTHRKSPIVHLVDPSESKNEKSDK